ncbi:MAG: polysaccharide biosynthesis tyrosine autokinase [Lachnospiraceae bacterium]
MGNTKADTEIIEKEIYRILRSNIEFTGVENKVIAVTSCRPNDGKSTVSYALASMFAEAEKTCVFVDADMRKSVLLQRLELKDLKIGLSDFLSGQKPLEKILYQMKTPNLCLIPTGKFPPNPTELLANERFAELIRALRQEFDYIIVDTPPLGNVIDAAVAAKICDGSILVVPSDYYRYSEVVSVKEQLYSANKNILGVVLNHFNIKRNGHNQGGYYGKNYSKY